MFIIKLLYLNIFLFCCFSVLFNKIKVLLISVKKLFETILIE